MLTEWLSTGSTPTLVLFAIGGMGKSSLAWAWLQRDVFGLPLPGEEPEAAADTEDARVSTGSQPEGVLWWSFYEPDAPFERFLVSALKYTGAETVGSEEFASTRDRITALAAILRERRFLLVLDGFERELAAYPTVSAPYLRDDQIVQNEDLRVCKEAHTADFLRAIASTPLAGRVLIISRLVPRELAGLAFCTTDELRALPSNAAGMLLRRHGVIGPHTELEDACERWGYHPLCLRLLAGTLVNDPEFKGDVRYAAQLTTDDLLKECQSNSDARKLAHIIKVAYTRLETGDGLFLSQMAAFRSPIGFEAIRAASGITNVDEAKRRIARLIDRGLLLRGADAHTYGLHPAVRGYAYDKLDEAEKRKTHERLRSYFRARVQPVKRVHSLEDITPTIELYHHTVHAGLLDEAFALFEGSLFGLLHYTLGAFRVCSELLAALIDTDTKAGFKLSPTHRAAIMRELAISYAACGKATNAIPLLQECIQILETTGDKQRLVYAHINLAEEALALGRFELAAQHVQRGILLADEDPMGQAFGHRVRSSLLSYRRRFDEAGHELNAASDGFRRSKAISSNRAVVECSRAQRALLMRQPSRARAAAASALKLWSKSPVKPPAVDIWAMALLGSAKVELARKRTGAYRDKLLSEADNHLSEAHRRCRQANAVFFESRILLDRARLHLIVGDPIAARQLAEEAREVADRCGYRIAQSDVELFMAELTLATGDLARAHQHVEHAMKLAWCDGPPHYYKPAVDAAERLLREIAW